MLLLLVSHGGVCGVEGDFEGSTQRARLEHAVTLWSGDGTGLGERSGSEWKKISARSVPVVRRVLEMGVYSRKGSAEECARELHGVRWE